MRKIFFFLMFLAIINLVCALSDFDKDGMPDSWEKKYSLKYDVNDANEDPDNDGIANLEEYNKGTNPLVADIEEGFFTKISSFFGEYLLKALVFIVFIAVVYFLFRIFIELKKIKVKKKQRVLQEKRQEIVFPAYNYKPFNEQPVVNVAPKPAVKKIKKFARKHKQINHLTYHFEEKSAIDEDISPLPYSYTGRIRKLKKSFRITRKPEVKEEQKKNIFDRLPRRQ
ncbi:MAG: thrombospondin type 3 repeat-containing protein [archaeon]